MMILLRAMVGVVATSTDCNWMKVDITDMINILHSNGHTYIDWYPIRLMKKYQWINFDGALIPSSSLPSSLSSLSQSRWPNLNCELMSTIVEWIANWKEWLNIREVCRSWRHTLTFYFFH
jgi:hypothetical protein